MSEVIIFSTADWDNPFWTNKQHMAKVFEQNDYRVIYVDSLGLRKPTLHSKDMGRIFRRLKGLFKPYKRVSDQIWRVSPFVLPFHHIPLVVKLNTLYLAFLVKFLAFFLRFDQPLIWTYSPASVKVVDYFRKNKIVYHCVDDIAASPGMDAENLNGMEAELAHKSDVVFVTAPALVDKLAPFNDSVFFFNNVADFEHFSTARSGVLVEPKELLSIVHPRVLFIGAISEYKVDFELIEFCALARPDWHWVMVGEVGEGQPGSGVGKLMEIPNVHFIGSKPYAELPNYLQHSDVAVIPARLNDYTKSMFPMKFFEYLSAGKQVVLTNLSSVHDYQDLSFIADFRASFLSHLSAVLDEGKHRDKDKILQVCQQQTWQKRFEEMMSIVLNIGRKQH